MRELNRLGSGIDEIGFRWRKRLETNRDSSLFRLPDRIPKCCGGPIRGLLMGNALQHIPLFRRADHHHLPAEVRAEIDQVTKVLGGAFADGLIRMVDIKLLWLDQNPVDASDFNLTARGRTPDPLPLNRRNIRH